MNKTFIIGIDDTDNKESRGTGFLSRELGTHLISKLNVELKGITRHQLFVHPDIPYTSQNSSACLEVTGGNKEDIINFCKDFLLKNAAIGSDVGLCVVEKGDYLNEIIDFGKRAKKEVVSKKEAYALATELDIFLKGLTGTLDGVIGALAAVGLRFSGNDGRFIWLKGLRDFKGGVFTASQLHEMIDFDLVLNKEFEKIPTNEKFFCEEWLRPVLKNDKKLIFATEVIGDERYKWQIASKEFFKSLSD